jgi:two-component system nitrogen regulation sensor histidine kinase NtrY
MPEHLMDKLIEPYITTRTKGTGLGLAIVKKIMTDHGGDLKLENNTDMGATITLVFYKNPDSRKETPGNTVRMAYGS